MTSEEEKTEWELVNESMYLARFLLATLGTVQYVRNISQTNVQNLFFRICRSHNSSIVLTCSIVTCLADDVEFVLYPYEYLIREYGVESTNWSSSTDSSDMIYTIDSDASRYDELLRYVKL